MLHQAFKAYQVPLDQVTGGGSPNFCSLTFPQFGASYSCHIELFLGRCKTLKWKVCYAFFKFAPEMEGLWWANSTVFSGCWFQPIWKILVKLDHFPNLGVKIRKNVCNHHLVLNWPLLNKKNSGCIIHTRVILKMARHNADFWEMMNKRSPFPK